MQNECYIVGGGPSLSHFNFLSLANKDTIVTNKAIFNVPFPSYFITVDYTFLKKIDIQSFRDILTSKIFVADFSHPFLKETEKGIVDTRYNLVYNLQDFNVIIKSHNSGGIGYTFDEFRTGLNSGFCALQLAVILGYRKIYFLGIDLNISNQTHYHKGYGESNQSFERKLNVYFQKFEKALFDLKQYSDIEVFNCSVGSRLGKILPYYDLKNL